MITTKKSNNVVTKLATAKKINYTPLVLIIMALLQGIIILQSVFQSSLLLRINEEPDSRFVELVNGQTLKTKPISAKERSPEVIQAFTRTMMENLFSASNNIRLSNNQTSENLSVEINEIITTEKTAISLLFLEPKFLSVLLEEISKATPPEVFQGEITRLLKIRFISQPKKVKNKEGYWSVEMIANLYSYSKQNKQLSGSKFNKKIQIKIVDYPTEEFQNLSLDLNDKILNLENKEYLKKLFYELSNAGLEISLISSL